MNISVFFEKKNLKKRFVKLTHKFNQLSNKQFGFRSKRFTDVDNRNRYIDGFFS